MALLFILIVNGLFGQSTLREKVCKTYQQEVGVRELSGNNDGSQVEMYLRSAGFGKGYAWCGAFVNWCFVLNGIRTVKAPAWAPSWFAKSNTIYIRGKKIREPPRQADVFGIYFASKKRIAHVGFVDKWGEQWVTTVEGNTNKAGSREGDGVYRKRRIKRQIYKVSKIINDEKYSDNINSSDSNELRNRKALPKAIPSRDKNSDKRFDYCTNRNDLQGYDYLCGSSCRYNCEVYRD